MIPPEKKSPPERTSGYAPVAHWFPPPESHPPREKTVVVTHAGDGSGRLFITEQIGVIRTVASTGGATSVWLDMQSMVTNAGHRGLHSIAFHPDYASNGKFYVSFTNTETNPETSITEFTVSPNPLTDTPSLGSAREVLTIVQDGAANHGEQGANDDGRARRSLACVWQARPLAWSLRSESSQTRLQAGGRQPPNLLQGTD